MTPLASLLALPAGWILIFAAGLARRRPAWLLSGLAIASCLAPLPAILASWRTAGAAQEFWEGAFYWDPFAQGLAATILVGTAAIAVLAMSAPRSARLPALSFPLLAVAAAVGSLACAATRDLATAFVAVEIVSVAGYALAGLGTKNNKVKRATEVSLKYFLFGAVATGLLAYGLALLYAGTGKMSLDAAAGASGNGFTRVGLLLFAVGLAVKAGAVPFHAWAPDVYTGASLPAAAFLSTVSKVAPLAILARLAGAALTADAALWTPFLWILAALTMTLGNLAAAAQTDLRRMLAYSSIAHTGYLLLGILAAAVAGRPPASVGLYLAAYTAMGIATFGFLDLRGNAPCSQEALIGLARRRPFLSAVLAVGLISLAGLPPTAGFAAKFAVFADAIDAGFVGLVILAVVNALVSVYYYVRALSWIYLRTPPADAPTAVQQSLEAGPQAPYTSSSLVLGVILFTLLAAGTTIPLAARLWN